MGADKIETREQKHARQTMEIHAALGRYVEAFEYLVHWVRGCCVLLTAHNPKHERLINIIFNDRVMAADTLMRIFRSMVGEMVNDKDLKISSEEKTAIVGVLKQIGSDYQAMVERRNDYLHGTWAIGWAHASEDDFSKIGFSRLKANSEGLQSVAGPRDVQEIDALTEECKRLQDFVMRFHACLTWHTGPRMAKNFVKADKRWVVRPHPAEDKKDKNTKQE